MDLVYASESLVAALDLEKQMRRECARLLKEQAAAAHHRQNDSSDNPGWTAYDLTGGIEKRLFVPPPPPATAIRLFGKIPAKNKFLPPPSRVGKRSNKDPMETMAKAYMKRLQRALVIKPPITHAKLLKLIETQHIPGGKDMYVAMAVETMARKYFTGAMKTFVEKTFVKHFFNTQPPYKLSDRSGVLWDTEFKGLMQTSVDGDGNLVRKPTAKLSHIIEYCSEIINGAYSALEVPPGTYHRTKEEAFIEMVTRYSRYAETVNNVSSDLSLNASALILWHFRKLSSNAFTFKDLKDSLADVERGSRDIEKVVFVHTLGSIDYLEDPAESAALNPKNVVAMGGDPYELLRPALRAEYILLKTLFWLTAEFGGEELRGFVDRTYRKRYEAPKLTVHNVLQMFPGLLTIVLSALQDTKGVRPPAPMAAELVKRLNHKLIVAHQMKGAGGRRAAIMRHNEVSDAMFEVIELFLDLAAEGNIGQMNSVKQYVSEMFLRSGFIKPAAEPTMGAIVL